MRPQAIAIAAIAIVAAGCSDSAETPRDFIEPVPFDETTTLPTTTIVTLVTTGFDAAAAFSVLIDEQGLGEVPIDAWADFALAGCEEGIWDRRVNFAFAEDFSQIEFANGSDLPDDQVVIAQLLWLKAADLCGGRFPAGAVDRGPPTVYQYPRCLQQLRVYALPWADEAGEPDIGQDLGQGIVYYTWREGDFVLDITQGADPIFDEQYNEAVPIGAVNGNAATAMGNEASVVVLWRQGPGHCDAFRMVLEPAPATDDLAVFVETLLQPPPAFANDDAEIRMAAAVPFVRGYTGIGGEPSHGGPDAVYAFEDEAAWYDVHAIPADIDDPDPPAIVGVIEMDGTDFELFDSTLGDGPVAAARFEADGYRITVRTSSNDSRLLTFAAEFHSAWLAAAP